MSQHDREMDFADVYLCSSEMDWHSYYYISPAPFEPVALVYSVNRTGIELELPRVFQIERRDSTRFCQIFCIFSGRGSLVSRGRTWPLHENQIVLLASGEAHSYQSDPDFPLGLIWLEFYGGDSRRLMCSIIDRCTPVLEGGIFQTVSTGLSALQQKLMAWESYQPSREIYELLYQLLQVQPGEEMPQLQNDIRLDLALIEGYLNTHLGEEIQNRQLAQRCGVSVQYFMKKFKAQYHMPPQEYRMDRRLVRSKYLLTKSNTPLDQIAAQLGFCNASHFIRRFKQREHMTPAAYRQQFSLFCAVFGAMPASNNAVA